MWYLVLKSLCVGMDFRYRFLVLKKYMYILGWNWNFPGLRILALNIHSEIEIRVRWVSEDTKSLGQYHIEKDEIALGAGLSSMMLESIDWPYIASTCVIRNHERIQW